MTQLTPRAIACISWIASQYAIRFDQLQRLLWRYTPEQDRSKLKPGVSHLSVDRTYEIINDWLNDGLVEKDILLHKDKMWIWASRKGLRTVQCSFHYSGAPAHIHLPHLYYINQVRLAIEEKRPNDLWKSEREIRREAPRFTKGEIRPHVPDALLTNTANGKLTAIEVERSNKNDGELEDDLRELAVTYKSIWYFVSTSTRRKIERMLDTFTPEMHKPFVLYDLKEYGDEYGLS